MGAYQEVLRADDDEISYDLLHWANLTDLWDENSEMLERYDLINDILEECEGVIVDREEWDANFPGRSGVMHIIFAKDPKALKIELRERIEKLLHPIPIEKKIEVDTHQMSTINLIISNLSREASIYRNLREPPGYRGMGAAVASAIETACRDLSTGEWSNEAIIERLSKLSQNNFGRSIKDKIEKMISDLRS